jgi:hypothetical protein
MLKMMLSFLHGVTPSRFRPMMPKSHFPRLGQKCSAPQQGKAAAPKTSERKPLVEITAITEGEHTGVCTR